MDKHRIIYYYQTFKGLSPILKENPDVTHIHLSAVHFGNNPDGSPYIHLNNYPPENPKFDSVWKDIEKASSLGIKIILMMGGAGSAYTDLFSSFDTYYPLLYQTIKDYPVINGIDLDIEEFVELDNIKMLINRLNKDFGSDFIITMAPIQNSLQTDEPGMGGFVYKDLWNSPEGRRIAYFNGQFYGDFSVSAYKQCIENGYPADKIVMGMITGQDFENVKCVIKELVEECSSFGGCFVWEYFNSPPGGTEHPEKWSQNMKYIMSNYHPSNAFDPIGYDQGLSLAFVPTICSIM